MSAARAPAVALDDAVGLAAVSLWHDVIHWYAVVCLWWSCAIALMRGGRAVFV